MSPRLRHNILCFALGTCLALAITQVILPKPTPTLSRKELLELDQMLAEQMELTKNNIELLEGLSMIRPVHTTGSVTRGELQDLLALERGLSEWEVTFIDSVSRIVANSWRLSPKQVQKIHEIWDRHCSTSPPEISENRDYPWPNK